MSAGQPSILAVVTARGGSKRLPGKNTRPLCGKPLIAWTIEAALSVRDRLHGVIVSTDDGEIAEISRRHGADVPFMRPPELAGDQAQSLPVVQHAVRFAEERGGAPVDWVLLLQPTSPLRSSADIAACIGLALERRPDSVISVVEMTHHHPLFADRIDERGFLAPFLATGGEDQRRNAARPAAYARNGAIFLTRRDVLMEQNSISGARALPYVMPEERSTDIDTRYDFLVAEALLSDRLR